MGTATRRDVARLFARAAFGASAADLDTWTGRPYEDAVSSLVDTPLGLRPPLPDEPRRIVIEQSSRTSQAGLPRGTQITLEQAMRWWLERMRTTPFPLEERMTLFWHDHFATGPGGPYPDVGMLVQQNQTLRRNALGNLRTMCEEITVDPAMLYWLNGAESTRRKPNENYGREFFELFTLGTIPQIYSESDIREAARALTGWIVDPVTRLPTFVLTRHDVGTKSVLGRAIPNLGDAEYKEVVDVALDQDIASRFIAYKMVLSFAYAPAGATLPADDDPLVAEVARTLRDTQWNLREAMRALLLHDRFRAADPALEQQVVRQPVDLVVAACRALGVTADMPEALTLLRRMGQQPFDPPNVGGWPVQRNWLSPVTMLARYDWGIQVHALWAAAPAPLRRALPASGDLEGWAALFGLDAFTTNTRSTIESYLTDARAGSEGERQAGVLALIVSSPDWMVM